MMGRVAVMALVVTLASSTLAQDKGKGRGDVEVTADKLHVDHQKRVARFEGNVRAVFDKLILTCKKMSLQYDDKGEVKHLSATGAVTVIRGDVRATAKVVRLDSKAGRLVLEGDPVIVKGPHRLTGQRIVVELSTGRIDVEAARGRFRLSKGGGG